MFSWRARRQLVAFLLIAAVFAGIAFYGASKFLPSPTCFDSRKNQTELGVDCGGTCAPCELRNPKSVSIFWARVARAAPGIFDAAALVENPNEVLSSASLRYEFIFFDDVGQIGQRDGSAFIFPQERVYIVEPHIELSRNPARVEFRIAGIDWQARQDIPPTLVVQDRQYRIRETPAGRQSTAEATIANASQFDFRRMETAIVVLDREGNLIGANRIVNENIRAGGTAEVVSLWPAELSGEAAALEIQPRVNIFLPDAAVKPQ
ncbi:MAG: hypothetical protein AAB915_00320 [Patescibacteria group bacterium]